MPPSSAAEQPNIENLRAYHEQQGRIARDETAYLDFHSEDLLCSAKQPDAFLVTLELLLERVVVGGYGLFLKRYILADLNF